MATILTKKKDTTGAPSAGDLTNDTGGAELAVNTADKRLYTKDSGGNVVEVGINPTSITTGTLNTSGAVVFNDAGADVDFRVESDTDANAFFLDGATGNIGVGVTPRNLLTSFGYKNIEVTKSAFFSFDVTASRPVMGFKSNTYFDASGNNKYIGDGFAAQYQTDEGNHIWSTAPNNTSGAGAALTFTERMRIDSSGNVLVNGTSAIGTDKLQVHNSNVFVYNTVGGRPSLVLRATNPSAQTWNTALKTDSSQNWYMISNPAESVGVYMTPSASGWNNLSDERAKKDWVELEGAVSKVMNLRAGTFAWVKDDTLPRDVGLIAQDVLSVLPEAVDTSDPDNWGVRYTHTIPLLVKAIQELKAELDIVKAELATLKG